MCAQKYRLRGKGRYGMIQQLSAKQRMRVWRNWQTRTVQVRMGATPWRFKSSHPHHGLFEIAGSTPAIFASAFAVHVTRIASTIALAALPSPSRPLPHIRAQMQTTPRELSRRDLLQVGPEPAVLDVERVERLVSEAFALQTPGRHGHAAVAEQHVRAHRPRTTSPKLFPFTLAKGASVSYSSSVNRMTAGALALPPLVGAHCATYYSSKGGAACQDGVECTRQATGERR